MWTKPQVSSLGRALATAQKYEAIIAKLEQMAVHNPEFAQRIAALRAKRDHLEQSGTIGLAVDPHGDDDSGK